MLVVYHHTGSAFFRTLPHDSLLGHIADLHISVSFFILLSGYVLSVIHLWGGREIELGGFFRARFARIYPLFLVTLLVDIPFALMDSIPHVGRNAAVGKVGLSFAGSILMLQGWNLHFRYLDYPNWSLSAEAFFYLIFPVAGVALWRLRGKSLWIAAAMLYVGGQVFVTVAARHMSGDLASRLPILHVSTFALGVLLARYEALHGGGKAVRTPALWAILAGSLMCFGVFACWESRIPLAKFRDGLLAPVLLVFIWAFSKPHWKMAQWLSARWLVRLGEASFGIYLLHEPVFNVFDRLGWSHSSFVYPVYLATVTGASLWSFHFFETPARRWILEHGEVRAKVRVEIPAVAALSSSLSSLPL